LHGIFSSWADLFFFPALKKMGLSLLHRSVDKTRLTANSVDANRLPPPKELAGPLVKRCAQDVFRMPNSFLVVRLPKDAPEAAISSAAGFWLKSTQQIALERASEATAPCRFINRRFFLGENGAFVFCHSGENGEWLGAVLSTSKKNRRTAVIIPCA